MERTVVAVYENGVLRPLEPLDLPEHKQVQVTVVEPVPRPDQDGLDTDYVRAVEKMDLPDVGLEDVRRTLSGIPGSMTADFIEEREERL